MSSHALQFTGIYWIAWGGGVVFSPRQLKQRETQRKAEQGIFRRSYWLKEQNAEMVVQVKHKHNLKTNDEAINMIIREAAKTLLDWFSVCKKWM